MFTNARCIGEKEINGDDCFILKICADSATLKARSEGPAEIIRHVLFGYFSQKTGLLVHIEDSHLTRMGRRNLQKQPEPLIIARSGSLRSMEALSPLREGPDQDDGEDSRMEGSWGHWMKGQLSRTPSVSSSNMFKRSDLRLLLGVLGAPLAPVHVSCAETSPHLSIKDNPIVSPFHHLLIVLHFMGYLVKCNAKF